jgi:hypothetical protein
MRRSSLWFGLACLAGCASGPGEDSAGPVPAESGWPDEWEYTTFCWFDSRNQCKLSDGTPVADERVNCIHEDDTYDCVTNALNDLGAEGWRLDLPDRSFPLHSVVYLMYRAG